MSKEASGLGYNAKKGEEALNYTHLMLLVVH